MINQMCARALARNDRYVLCKICKNSSAYCIVVEIAIGVQTASQQERML